MLAVTNSRSSSVAIYNQTALFEKNTRSQQDQCWETYVGQVLTHCICVDAIDMNKNLKYLLVSCRHKVCPFEISVYSIYKFPWCILCAVSSGDVETVHHWHDLHRGEHPAHWLHPRSSGSLLEWLLLLGFREQVCKLVCKLLHWNSLANKLCTSMRTNWQIHILRQHETANEKSSTLSMLPITILHYIMFYCKFLVFVSNPQSHSW